jgi:hypothetical protein
MKTPGIVAVLSLLLLTSTAASRYDNDNDDNNNVGGDVGPDPVDNSTDPAITDLTNQVTIL